MSCQGGDGICHGTFAEWFNRFHKGAAETVEFPASQYISTSYTNNVAVLGSVGSLGGTI